MVPSVGLRMALAFIAALLFALPAAAAEQPAFGHAAIVQRDGEPTLTLDGKPFFFWGAAFFYERLPPSQWRASMEQLRELGVNTLDLYVPWNWHELADGDFDFDGHTNPRRNLRQVLQLGRELGFAFIVRPGPVIRNEWRNGGYPAWLLQRPEYGMPLHDVLEGRYPATATLQNAHSDDAAAEWMRNATHMRYAARWLHTALAEFRPVADRVLAVQLDDDQGAYIDNQTYPAPHLVEYLGWLERQARDVVGPVTPAFINTYEMRVPASVPVWTMGNWYQSDAYAIGEHDRVALDVATATLRTNRRGPLAQSEFQAGWLAQPEDPLPRPADPANTTLALYELLAWGAHGIVDFPMQDTLAPFGWEAPFSNALYAWDAALRYPDNGIKYAARYRPTWQFGQTVDALGPLLADARRIADVALAYTASTYPGDPSNGGPAFERFREDVRACTERGTPCEIVDLGSVSLERLRLFHTLVVDDVPTRNAHGSLLQGYARAGGIVTTSVPRTGFPGTLLHGRGGSVLVVANWNDTVRTIRARRARIGGVAVELPSIVLPARSARAVALDVSLRGLDRRYRADARLTTDCDIGHGDPGIDLGAFQGTCSIVVSGTKGTAVARLSAGEFRRITFDGTLMREGLEVHETGVFAKMGPRAELSPTTTVTSRTSADPANNDAMTFNDDIFEGGGGEIVLQNARARVVIVPNGGARVPIFHLLGHTASAFDATGGLRDDALLQPPLSTTDRIAKYTHSFPAGTFNRSYSVSDARDGSVRLTADIPDIVPTGARIERVLTLAPRTTRLVVDERATFAQGPDAERQRLVTLSSLAIRTNAGTFVDGIPGSAGGTLRVPRGIAYVRRGGCDAAGSSVLAVSWRPGDVESAAWEPHRSNGTLRLVLAPGWRRATYALACVAPGDDGAVRSFVEAERAWVAANPATGR